MKKILVIGANGTLGKAVTKELSSRHTVVTAGRNSGDFKVDLADKDSIAKLYAGVGKLDAVACVAGSGIFAPLEELNPDNFANGLNEKMLGQINLVLQGQHLLADNGSFTLISGVLNDEPILQGINSSTINAAIDGFVKACAIELKRGIRINAVSPTVVTESMALYGDFFRGFDPVPVIKVAYAYSKSIEGHQTGQVYKIIR